MNSIVEEQQQQKIDLLTLLKSWILRGLVAVQLVSSFSPFPSYMYPFQVLLPPGGWFRNFWVGMCRWDPGTLSLYQSNQSSFKWTLLSNPPSQSSCFPETTEVTNTVQPKPNRFDFFIFLRVLMGIPNSQLTTIVSAKYQLTANPIRTLIFEWQFAVLFP